MNRRAVCHQLHGKVAVHRSIVKEVGLDDLRLVAEAEHEVLESVLGVLPHDVPQNRAIADSDHRLRTCLGFLAKTRSQPSA